MMVLIALSTIASEQTKGTERTLEKAYQVLDYLATHPNAVVRFRLVVILTGSLFYGTVTFRKKLGFLKYW